MQYNKAQYNNYPRKNYGNSKDSNGGTAKLTKTKKDGLILVVKLNNQNLVLKGFWDIKYNCWKLFPYYDKTKTNPQFNKPQQPRDEMDDPIPTHMKEWEKSPAPTPQDDIEFVPEQYEEQNNS